MLHSRPAFVGEIIFAAILATLVVWMSGYSPVLFLSDAAANFASPFKIVKRLSWPSNATDVAWSPDGLKLATLSEYGTIVTIWDASDWQIVREFRRNSGGDGLNNLIWLPNGQILTRAPPNTGEQGRYSLNLWNVESGTLAKNIVGPTDENSLKFNHAMKFAASKDGSTVAMTNARALRQVFLLDAQTWAVKATLTLNQIPTALSFGADNLLAVGATGGELSLFDLTQNTLDWTINAFSPGTRNVLASAFSPDGAFLASAPAHGIACCALESGPIRIWKTHTSEQVASLGSVKDDQSFPQVAWSPDGTLLAAASFSGAFYVWRVGTNQVPIFTAHFPLAAYATSFSSNGMLAVAQGDEVLILK